MCIIMWSHYLEKQIDGIPILMLWPRLKFLNVSTVHTSLWEALSLYPFLGLNLKGTINTAHHHTSLSPSVPTSCCFQDASCSFWNLFFIKWNKWFAFEILEANYLFHAVIKFTLPIYRKQSLLTLLRFFPPDCDSNQEQWYSITHQECVAFLKDKNDNQKDLMVVLYTI